MIRLGFVGLGGMGRAQIAAFEQVRGCRITAGADVSAPARAGFVEKYPRAAAYRDHRELLASAQVDAVVIAVPTGLHYRLAADALKARKPLLLEKPMARTVAECRKLNALARNGKTTFMIAQCRRYDAYWSAWAKAVKSGRLGLPVLWRHVMAGQGPGRWFMDEKLGGGPLLDGAVHNYDFANWLFGDPVSVIASSIKLDRKVSAIDTASAAVRYASGSQLLVSWSWGARGCSLHDIIGPQGFIQFGPGDLKPPAQEKGKYSYCCLTNLKGKETLIKAKAQPPMLVRQARHFLDCVRGQAKCQSPGTEAIKAVAVAEAILKAAPEGRARRVKW